MKNIVLMGPPGSGKGTQAELINKKYNLPHISTGEILREHIKNRTELGLKASSFIMKGELVPDNILIDIIKTRLKENDAQNGFILDGYPRTIPQAEALDRLKKIDLVLNIEVSEEELIRRLSGRRVCRKCGANFHLLFKKPRNLNRCDLCGGPLYQRDDDKEEAIKTRLKVYKRQTKPLIDYYKNKNILININGENDIEIVFEEICKFIDKDQHI